ncbi:MAG TPA: HU family DNA-binding protein [Vicinamibacterales bacterium]|nr:HU family DNA-binding protein [Vicinamibacterales bacterium]
MPTKKFSKSELYRHFAQHLDVKQSLVGEIFTELSRVSEQQLKTTGEFVIPGVVKLVLRHRKARVGRNPMTGEPIQIAERTVVKAKVASQLQHGLLGRPSRPGGPEGNDDEPTAPGKDEASGT